MERGGDAISSSDSNSQPDSLTRDNLHHNRGSHNGDGEDSAETRSRFFKFINVSP